MRKQRKSLSEKSISNGAKAALDTLTQNPLVRDLERAQAEGDTDGIKRAQDALDKSTKDLPPLDPLLVEFVKALARDHARQDNRAAARDRGDHVEIEGPKGRLQAFLDGGAPSASRSTLNVELLEHRGYQIRLSQSGLEWMAFVALPKQRPTLIMAPDRNATIAKAHEWIEAQLPAGETSTVG